MNMHIDNLNVFSASVIGFIDTAKETKYTLITYDSVRTIEYDVIKSKIVIRQSVSDISEIIFSFPNTYDKFIELVIAYNNYMSRANTIPQERF
jgi:hypothetical protein